MRKSRYTDSQIMAIIKQNEQGVAVNELCREHGISSAQFYSQITIKRHNLGVAKITNQYRHIDAFF